MKLFNALNKKSLTFFTFHKCGSQWVRDVLNSQEISKRTKLIFDPRELNLNIHAWTGQRSGTLLGPVYNCSYNEWLRFKKRGQRALVVLRDPRDRMISLIYSILYSHVEEPFSNYVREQFKYLNGEEKIKHAKIFGAIEFSGIASKYESWLNLPNQEDLYITTYEKINENALEEFEMIMSHFSFNVPKPELNIVLDRLSFEKRSGRKKGVEDIKSHYRSGSRGDWKKHFTDEDVRLWKSIFQNLLVRGGWEKDENWSLV
jgi:Sulfotransferase domain